MEIKCNKGGFYSLWYFSRLSFCEFHKWHHLLTTQARQQPLQTIPTKFYKILPEELWKTEWYWNEMEFSLRHTICMQPDKWTEAEVTSAVGIFGST